MTMDRSASVPRPQTGVWSALALLPMLLAILGAALDEQRNLGFSNWRSACRSAGFSLPSLLTFTLELMPMAVLGLLIGGVGVQAVGICLRHSRGAAAGSLAAHGACGIGMVLGLPLCALPLSVPWLLGAELLLTVLAAMLLDRLPGGRQACAASGIPPIRRAPSA